MYFNGFCTNLGTNFEKNSRPRVFFSIIDIAARGGNFDIVKWLCENNLEKCTENTIDRAMASG